MPLELTLPEATKRLRDCLFASMRRNDRLHPEEADPELNDASRRVIAAMAAANGGECWLGHVNLDEELPDDDDDRYEPANWTTPLWKWTGRTVYNFGASFVMPRYDAQLEQLILQRDAAPYTTIAADYQRVTAIQERLDAVGAVNLFWS